MSKYPKIHNSVWPGLVGKEPDTDHPPISLDKMLELTASAEVNGNRFDGFDIFLFSPHFDFDGGDAAVDSLVEKASALNLTIGSIVAPIWEGTGGGSCIGNDDLRKQFLEQIRKACEYASKLREKGARPYGIVRVDTGCPVTEWVKDIDGNQKKIIDTFKEAATIAEGYGEKLGAEGEICWEHSPSQLAWCVVSGGRKPYAVVRRSQPRQSDNPNQRS